MRIVAPIVHLNGTSKEELLRLRSDAYDALNVAFGVLKKAAPNGRDYYPCPGLMMDAIDQHTSRLMAILVVMKSIETEMQLIEEGRTEVEVE
jgi:hypothetical protein